MAEAPVHLPDGAVAPDGLLEAFWAYEAALMANDLAALDRLFAPGPDTLRGDAAGLLVGHEAISRFRGRRGGAPRRAIRAVHVRPLGPDDALVIAVTEPAGGGRGQQTQLWKRAGDGWAVTAAHVSLPAPAIDPRIWRVVAAPLVPGRPRAPLAGHRVAVKDLFAVAGQRIGAGVPEFLAEAPPQREHAAAVSALLSAGAEVTGIAQTDEFAYSIAGLNPHYGTPPNPAVVGAVPGGSSSGPATAVGLGQATIGLATDTGGSIRVPASYQGLWGLRTTHGAVDPAGLLPLAPSFDTVGWLTRDPDALAAAASASLDAAAQRPVPGRFVIAPAIQATAEPAVAGILQAAIAAAGLDPEPVELPAADELFTAFRTLQAAEAWQVHGPWITAHPGALGEDIAARFAWASSVSAEQHALAERDVARLRDRIRDVLGDRVLLLPAASSVAPSVLADAAAIESTRAATLRMTAVAGVAGLPALSVPGAEVGGAPVGLCLVGPRFSDLALIGHGRRLAPVLADMKR